MPELAVVILAAGHGTRMNSKTQKVLHEVGGKPMIQHAFDAASTIASQPPVVVVGRGEHGVQDLLGHSAGYVEQAQRLGTGHATLMAAPLLEGKASQVIVTYGDMPLLQAETLRRLADRQAETGAAVVLLSVMGSPNSSFGRVVRDAKGQVMEIVEVAEARRRPDGEEILATRELNAGVYCFDASWLWANLPHLPLRQARSGQEYYLTDLVGRAVSQGEQVEALVTDDPDECLGAGTRAELVAVEQAFRRRANRKWLARGVTLIDPNTTYIDQDVAIGQDTIIWPNSYIQSGSVIGADCQIGPNSIIRNARLGDGCRVEQAVVENAILPDNETVSPFTLISDETRNKA